ncbi:Quinic acid utilization activator [Smittium mucronatum]|uniref:Quinic acid utilization activator n=1 Tax=Smittium mucronatum TaxID=133383 RepID=A0A1R0H6B7_9FUNG|nr:Quinic acid utilization activator [Smittium mucronatum]
MKDLNNIYPRSVVSNNNYFDYSGNIQFKAIGGGYTFYACDSCRRKRIRCDGIRPICNICKNSDRKCIYKETISSPTGEETINIDKSLYNINIKLELLYPNPNMPGNI